MIIYGSKTTLLVKKTVSDECSDCGAENSMDLTLYQRYTYFLGIPLVPTSKMPMTECTNCRKVLEQSEFPPSILYQSEMIKKEIRTPVWTFFGLALLFSVIGMFCFFLLNC